MGATVASAEACRVELFVIARCFRYLCVARAEAVEEQAARVPEEVEHFRCRRQTDGRRGAAVEADRMQLLDEIMLVLNVRDAVGEPEQ